MTTTKTAAAVTVPLGRLWGRVGGDKDRVLRLVAEVGEEVIRGWDGDEAVDVGTAAKVVALHEQQVARGRLISEGYQKYWAAREREKRAIREFTYQAARKRLHAEQRDEFRAMPFVSGGEYLSLDPRRAAIANREANAAVEAWEGKNPPVTDEVEWARKEGL
jgi:hypothetical protein